MSIASHVVGIEQGVEPPLEVFARDADVHRDGLCAAIQAVQMAIEKGDPALMDP